jgi:hypothetical protein
VICGSTGFWPELKPKSLPGRHQLSIRSLPSIPPPGRSMEECTSLKPWPPHKAQPCKFVSPRKSRGRSRLGDRPRPCVTARCCRGWPHSRNGRRPSEPSPDRRPRPRGRTTTDKPPIAITQPKTLVAGHLGTGDGCGPMGRKLSSSRLRRSNCGGFGIGRSFGLLVRTSIRSGGTQRDNG